VKRQILVAISAVMALVLSPACRSDSEPAHVARTRATTTTTTIPRTERLPGIDVDGDGVTDSITVRRVYNSPRDRQQVTLLTVETEDAGDTAAIVTEWTTLAPWFGAAEIDNTPGAELVFRRDSGAHIQTFVVYTWRHGSLVEERAPGAPDSGGRWVVDAAYNSVVGVDCTVIDGVHYVTLTNASPDDPMDDVLVGDSTVWTSDAEGGWRKVRSQRISLKRDAPDEYEHAGWSCPGLPERLD
jgi:hypothetical protein